MEDPKVEKVAEVTSPGGDMTILISFWSDGIVSHCLRKEKEQEVDCSSIPFKFRERGDQERLFNFELDRYKKEGYSVRVLHDPEALSFLPSMEG